MPSRHIPACGAVLALVASTLTIAAVAGPAVAAPPAGTITVSLGPIQSNPHSSDTPAASYLDKDGTYYAQFGAALYGPDEPRHWTWFSGADYSSMSSDTALDTAVDPANSQDSNADTTYRCNHSPTGQIASANPSSPSDQLNYCDLLGVYVDPDTGTWHGLVHNEFTMDPFTPTGYHYDAIDYASSTDQGHTWSISGHAITSPFSVERADTAGYPESTWYFGDGDPRLYADHASGYVYVFYLSRVLNKPGQSGRYVTTLAHVARAPMSGKLAPGTWSKWYQGAWSQPGIGGQESNMVPVDDASSTGWTPAGSDYSPSTPGSIDEQIDAGTLPSKSPLVAMNITYNAHLGLYIGEPEILDQDSTAPQTFYATDNLATQKWSAIGTSGTYKTASWYRWTLDSANLTSPTITGKTMRGFFDGQFTDITFDTTAPAVGPTTEGVTYQIGSGAGRYLTAVAGSTAVTSTTSDPSSARQQWAFVDDKDGSYTILNAATGEALSVPDRPSGRAWGTAPTVSPVATPTVAQQWFVVAMTDPSTGATVGTYRLVNRYSGLVLALSTSSGRPAETTPTRAWTDPTNGAVGGGRTAAEQTLSLTAVGTTTVTLRTDLARNKPTTASSVEANTSFTAGLATDGNPTTRWSSGYGDPQWIRVDLGSTRAIDEVRLSWEAAYAQAYQVQASSDGATWTTISSTTTGDGGTDDLTGLSGSGRYVRVYATQRATGYGDSLFDLEVYGQPAATPTNLSAGRPTTASSVEDGTSFTAGLATDGDPATRWSSGYSDPQWIAVDLGATRTINRVALAWEAAYAQAYQVQVSMDGTTWTTAYATTTGDGGLDDLTGLTATGRYVRVLATERATGYGDSLWSLDVYGS